MGNLAAILLHLGLTLSGGAALLAFCGATAWPALPFEALVLGLFAETTLTAALLTLGLHLSAAQAITWAIALAGLGFALWRNRPALLPPRPSRPAWHEWLLLAVATEKVISVGRALAASPIIFDDALTAWAGRARSLYGGMNFSLDPASPTFLGFTGPKEYPLATPLWNAGTVLLAGGWDDILARADGVLAWVALAGLLWTAVRQKTECRLAASLAGLAMLLLPFPFWHTLSGYADLSLGAAATACLVLLVRGAYLPSGLAAAAAVWIKNDALFIYVPALVLACVLRAFPLRELLRLRLNDPAPLKCLGLFLTGAATCAPWLVYRAWASDELTVSLPTALSLLGAAGALAIGVRLVARSRTGLACRLRSVLTATGLPLLMAVTASALALAVAHRLGTTALTWHPEAPELFLKILTQATHAVLWPFIGALLLVGAPRLAKDPAGRAALAGFLGSLAAMFFIFSCTPAFAYLLTETTVHRSLLQLYGPALLAAFLGLAPARTAPPPTE